jgi:tellurite resistance protein
MTATAEQFRTTLKSVHPAKLSAEDAETIVELAQMAVDADGQEDVDEIKTFFAIGKAIYELAGLGDTPTPTFIGDDDDLERIRDLGAKLSSTEARELAYATAHLLSVVDVQIAPEEDAFLEKLRVALGIGEDRANDLATKMSASITPAE